MTNTAVTPFSGVTSRPDSTRWWFVLRTPQDLLHRFNGNPWAARCSLKTSDLREANSKARMLQAEWAQRFDAMLREDNPQQVDLNPALVAAIVSDDYAHLTPAILGPVLERLTFPGLNLPQVFMNPSWTPAQGGCRRGGDSQE